MSATPHRTMKTPTSRATFTPCTKMNKLTLNSQSGTNRTSTMNYHQQASDFGKRMFEVAGEEDDTPEHPNLTMVLGPQKISFDQLLDDDHAKPSYMLLSDEDDSDEETSNTFSPCRMSLSPDRGFPQQMMELEEEHTKDTNHSSSSSSSSSPLLFSKKLSKFDSHYDPNFTFDDGVYEDEQDDHSFPTLDLSSFSQNDNENMAPPLWLKHFNPTVINLKKTPVTNTNIIDHNPSSNSSVPLQEITVNHNLPSIVDEPDERHTQKIKAVGERPQRMRMMRSLSPTREHMRKGKEPSTTTKSDSSNNNKHLDASVAFFL